MSLSSDVPDDVNSEAMERSLRDMLVEFAAKNGKMSKESVAQLMETRGLRRLVDQIAANIPLQYTGSAGTARRDGIVQPLRETGVLSWSMKFRSWISKKRSEKR